MEEMKEEFVPIEELLAMPEVKWLIAEGIAEKTIWGYPKAVDRVCVLYVETFAKCFSGGFSIDTKEEALDIYNMIQEHGKIAKVGWLSKKHGYLPLYWTADLIREDGYDLDALGLPENPADQFYRDHFKKLDEEFEEEKKRREKDGH